MYVGVYQNRDVLAWLISQSLISVNHCEWWIIGLIGTHCGICLTIIID